jgi:nicotinate-nucleotide adenylyltransferase
MKHRIGIYPGTFNPLHIGHISFAQQALETCGLERVVFLPERAPRGKIGVAHIDSRVRFAEQQLSNYPNFEIRTLKATPQTLEAQRRELKDIFDRSTVVLLVGTDTLTSLADWQDIDTLLRDHELCVGIRDDETNESVAAMMARLESVLERSVTYHIVETPHRHVSSTRIRSASGYRPL